MAARRDIHGAGRGFRRVEDIQLPLGIAGIRRRQEGGLTEPADYLDLSEVRQVRGGAVWKVLPWSHRDPGMFT